MRRFHKMAAVILMVLSLMAALPVAAYAREVPDLNHSGSISLTLTCSGTPVTGGTFQLWRVGNAKEDDGDFSFEKTEDFSDYTGTLDEIGRAETAEKLANFVSQKDIEAAASAGNTAGGIFFGELQTGLYLIEQTEAADGYEKISPFLVSIPQEENGQYIYEVNATPKMEALVPTPATPGSPDQRLPQTGQLNWPVPVLACAGMLLFGMGWALNRTGKRKNEK